MRAMAALLVSILTLVTIPASAQDVDVVPIMMGQQAPWSGLLVREARFTQMLQLQTDLDELRKKYAVAEKLCLDTTAVLQKQLKAAQADLNRRVQPEPWYKSHWFVLGLGVFLGVGTTLGAVYGAGQLK